MQALFPQQTRRHLAEVYRAEVLAVNQHFIDILTLGAWGDTHSVAAIRAVDNVDFPNAMRLAGALVADGAANDLITADSRLEPEMPHPGATTEAVLVAEADVEHRVIEALDACGTLDIQYRHLIDVPRAAHHGFGDWIGNRLKESSGTISPPLRRLPEAAHAALNDVFAVQVFLINQGLVHAFVHRFNQNKALANATWTSITAVMHQAADIVTLMAKRGNAVCPAESALMAADSPITVAANSETAARADRTLSATCADLARRAIALLGETEFEGVLAEIAGDRHRWSSWYSGQPEPITDAPCRDFDRVLEKYVWLDIVA